MIKTLFVKSMEKCVLKPDLSSLIVAVTTILDKAIRIITLTAEKSIPRAGLKTVYTEGIFLEIPIYIDNRATDRMLRTNRNNG